MKFERKDNTITITLDASDASLKNASPSGSGKTLLVDTGNTKLPMGAFGNLTVQVSAYIPNPAFKAAEKAKTAKAA